MTTHTTDTTAEKTQSRHVGTGRLKATWLSDVRPVRVRPLPERALNAIRAIKLISHTCSIADRHAIDPDDTLFAAIETLRKIAYHYDEEHR